MTINVPARRLVSLYAQVFAWYMLGVAALWVFGVESIYGSPTPFYALYAPIFTSLLAPAVVGAGALLLYFVVRWVVATDAVPQRVWGMGFGVWGLAVAVALVQPLMRRQALSDFLVDEWLALRWHVAVLVVLAVFMIGALAALKHLRVFETDPPKKAINWFLVGLVAFAIIFPCVMAMLRDGPHGITQAYERQTYEYVGDIGITRTIQQLFGDYLKVHEHLSMHAKVHPPGPIALLWILSFLAGREALGMSLATIFVGALGVIPMYYWAADVAGKRAGLIAAMMYALTPTIVLFTATSADILFMPFVLTTLWFFWRAIERGRVGDDGVARRGSAALYALGAGVAYAVCSLLSFSLLSLGAFFAFVGLWRLADRRYRVSVVQTAVVMVVGFLLIHGLVRWWSGYDTIAVFNACRDQFNTDQIHLDQETPRFAAWTYKFWNPACWFYFAGIPASVLFIRKLLQREAGGKAFILVFALTLVVLDLLYLARGEGERSAMYIVPFVILPAACLLDEVGYRARSLAPLAATLGFLAFQCWITESLFYTFW